MGNLSPLKIIYLKLHFGNGRHLIIAVFIVFLLFGFVGGAIRFTEQPPTTSVFILSFEATRIRKELSCSFVIVLALTRGLIILHLSSC